MTWWLILHETLKKNGIAFRNSAVRISLLLLWKSHLPGFLVAAVATMGRSHPLRLWRRRGVGRSSRDDGGGGCDGEEETTSTSFQPSLKFNPLILNFTRTCVCLLWRGLGRRARNFESRGAHDISPSPRKSPVQITR